MNAIRILPSLIPQRILEGEMRKLVGDHDRFVFYWSGHGDQLVRGDKSSTFGFLPLYDSKRGQFESMVGMEDIARWNSYLDARHALFILDSCLSGLAGVNKKSNPRLDQMSLPARYLLTAGAANEEVIAGDRWGGSLFTDSLMKVVREHAQPEGATVSIFRIFDEIQERVAVERQKARWSKPLTPQLRDLQGGDGAFFFVARNMAVPAKSNPTPTISASAPAAPVDVGKYSETALKGGAEGLGLNQQQASSPSSGTTKSGTSKETATSSDVDGLRNGPGRITMTDGTVFEGNFEKGKLLAGTVSYTNGDKYEGSLQDYRFNGEGTWTHKNGSIQKGTWLLGTFVSGVSTNERGNISRGKFENGKKVGFFTETFADGSTFEGEYQAGVRNGKGKLTGRDGTVQSGRFENNQFVDGTWTWGTSKYVGPVVNGRFNGVGTYSDRGFVSTGNRIDGKRNGQFSETSADGSRFDGIYKDDARNGRGKLVMASGDVFEGIFANNEYSNGTYTFSNGDSYVGTYIHSQNGTGTYTFNNGTIMHYVNGQVFR